MEAPLSKGAGRVSGLGGSDGLCVAAHSRATSAREKGPGCRPPSPLSSATHSRHPVGAGHARPAASPLPPLYPLHRREGSCPLRGASGTPPPTTQSAGLLINANVRGGLGAGRPTSHFTTFRGAGLRPRPIHATLPLPPRILCIVGRQATGSLHNRPAPSNTKITCLRPLAGRLFF